MFNVRSKTIRAVGPLGGYRLCRRLSNATPRILMYHRFSEEPRCGFVHRAMFERQIEYLSNNFNMMSQKDLINEYRKNGIFPENAVVITIDDGYRDFYDIAYPVLKQHGVPATFFITTRFIDGDFWLWPDRLDYILGNSHEVDLSCMPGNMDYHAKPLNENSRDQLWELLVSYLLSITEEEKNIWLDDFARVQSIQLPVVPTEDYSAASWGQIKDMSANNIEMGAHTLTHPSLGRLSENELSSEIDAAAGVMKKKLGFSPVSFCYPNGQPADYTESVKKQVEQAGFESAVTAYYDEHLLEDAFALRRFNISTDWWHFMRLVNGVDVLAAKWLKTNNIMQVPL